MMDPSASLPKIVVIAGTNASGKSGLGIRLAEAYGGEIVSADSRQVYRGFDLCCGKVTDAQRRRVPHFLLDVCEIGEPFSVSDYQKMAYAAIDGILSRKKLPIVVGGTGLYISALVYGYTFEEEREDPGLRASLTAKSLEQLQGMVPPKVLASLNDSERGNKRRLVRIVEKTEKGEDIRHHNEARYDALQLGVTWPKELLAQRIHERLALRLQQGMIEEVRAYLDKGGDVRVLEALGLEYRYLARYLSGAYGSYEDFFEELSRQIRQFAKRQRSWFKRDQNIHWLDMTKDGFSQACALMDAFLHP